ncbi:2,3,4,5-tetrahydropyridine-2,6-dicarboxylate N-succinyltransferase, partial [Pseudomonas aeruginosa]
SFQAKNVVLMPSYVNIGAYVDEGTMVDTWATVGSCAQIGKNVHLSGGVGIGGVLEPLQANPTIIEDNCFIGARSEIVEGVIVEEGSVISMGVYIGQSTRIYDRETG